MKSKDIINKIILFIFPMLFIPGCNSIKKNYIPSIKVSYLKGTTERIIRVNCGEISRMPTMEYKIDTIISNKNQINDILNQVKRLKTLDRNIQTPCDVRMDCTINLSNDSIKICIGEFDCILKDGHLMERNDTLLFIIRENSGYYNFFPKKELIYFEELKLFGEPHNYKHIE